MMKVKKIAYSSNVLNYLKNQTEYHIRVASTTMCPASVLIDTYKCVLLDHLEFKMDIIYLDEDRNNKILQGIGGDYDLVVTLFDKEEWFSKYNFFKIKDEPIQLMMRPDHPLAKYSSLSIEQLENTTICLAKEGYSLSCDLVRDFIQKQSFSCCILDRSIYYNSKTFNQCLVSDVIYPTLEPWNEVNLLLKCVPISWNLNIPYGIFYSEYVQKK